MPIVNSHFLCKSIRRTQKSHLILFRVVFGEILYLFEVEFSSSADRSIWGMSSGILSAEKMVQNRCLVLIMLGGRGALRSKRISVHKSQAVAVAHCNYYLLFLVLYSSSTYLCYLLLLSSIIFSALNWIRGTLNRKPKFVRIYVSRMR